MTKEAMKLALEALENSVDLVREDAYEAEKLYGNYPTRQGKVNGLKVLADDHEKAITALREALASEAIEQPAQQDSTCSNGLRAQGKAYPRTCKKCGFGPCVAMANKALDKKAENARELGLDYEPAPVQQEPEWYHFVRHGDDCFVPYKGQAPANATALYTSPPTLSLAQQDIQRLIALVRAQQITIDKLEAQRKPLTYEEITAISKQVAEGGPNDSIDRFVRAIEAAHGIKENI
jgi:hypothetical protein